MNSFLVGITIFSGVGFKFASTDMIAIYMGNKCCSFEYERGKPVLLGAAKAVNQNPVQPCGWT